MATPAHHLTQTQLNVPHPNLYKQTNNIQKPPKEIHVQIPWELLQEKQAIEVVANGKRLNGHIELKQTLPHPRLIPNTTDICVGKIKIFYTDAKKEMQFYEMLGLQANGETHLRGKYHFHFIPNGENDIKLLEYNNSRVIKRPLSFNPHSTTVMNDKCSEIQMKTMMEALDTAADSVCNKEYKELFEISDLRKIYKNKEILNDLLSSGVSDAQRMITVMDLCNDIKNRIHEYQNQSNHSSHGMLGNVVMVNNENKNESVNEIMKLNDTRNTQKMNTNHESVDKKSENKKKTVLIKCPFGCGNEYQSRPSLNKHLLEHCDDDNYEQILPHACAKANCDGRFETKKFLSQHDSGAHGKEREPLEPSQACPKCIACVGTNKAGVIMKGCWKRSQYRKVYCSLGTSCGWTQGLKAAGHVYIYNQRVKKKKI